MVRPRGLVILPQGRFPNAESGPSLAPGLGSAGNGHQPGLGGHLARPAAPLLSSRTGLPLGQSQLVWKAGGLAVLPNPWPLLGPSRKGLSFTSQNPKKKKGTYL